MSAKPKTRERIGQRKGDRPPKSRMERWLVEARRHVNMKTIGGVIVAGIFAFGNEALDRWYMRQMKLDEQYFMQSRQNDLAQEMKRLCADNPKISERCK